MINDTIIIREATIEDAPILVHLNAAFNGSSDPAEQLAQRLADPKRVETALIAEVDQQIAGFAALRVVPCIWYAAPHAELTELYVEEPYRRHGVARALIAYAEQLARRAGAQELLVQTGHNNQPALALYHAVGFEDYDLSLLKQL
jgi:ribosomal protein S18 acetylase RimI-like enzyme